DIAEQIVRIARHPYAKEPSAVEPATHVIADILALIRSIYAVDFAHCKQTTVTRRIRRRMALRDCRNLDEYRQILLRDRDELNNLYQDLLIRVTQFFRDPDAFEILKT